MGYWLSNKGFLKRARFMYGQKIAASALHRAVKKGEIPPASEFDCVDCGNPAGEYDHRDYNKPLDVVPVCRLCNVRRGPAIPMKPLPKGCMPKVYSLRDKLKADRDFKINKHVEKRYEKKCRERIDRARE